MKNTRYLTIEHYRNLGAQKEQKILINEDLHKVGGLVILLGENNVGKSNVLNAFHNFDKTSSGLNAKDKPNFLESEANPKLSLCYEYESDVEQEKCDFVGKTFALYLTQGALEKGLEIGGFEDIQSYEAHLQELFDNADILALHDLDEQSTREEIRLILENAESENERKMFLCSVKKGQKFECFVVMKKETNEIKNYDKAIKLECKFHIDLKKKAKCDDANELKDYLKLRYETKQSVSKQTKIDSFDMWLDENDELCGEYTFFKNRFFNEVKLAAELVSKLKALREIFDNRTLTLSYDFRDRYNDLREKCNALFEAISEANLQDVKDFYEEMQEFFNEAKEYYMENSYNHKNEFPHMFFENLENFAYDVEYDDTIYTKFSIPAKPHIIFYTQEDIQNKDLSTSSEDIESSVFFPSLFKHLDEDITKVAKVYEKSRSKNTAFYKQLEKELNQKIKEKIDTRFNEIYYQDSKKESYHFEIHLEESKIAFSMYKNDETIVLEEQSTGFQKFFSFFFDFIYDESLQRGDIILIDEAETHLSIPAQKDFRAFLKDFGQKMGLTFIISTHSPFMIDINHLDEVRIIAENPKGKGAVIYNDFSLSAKFQKSNALYEIQKALGIDILSKDKKLIFVEGLTDYHYLNAFKALYEKEKGTKCNLVFLPVSGLLSEEERKDFEKQKESENSNKNTTPAFTPYQKALAQNLNDLAKLWRINPVLLTDSDKAGEAMRKGVENDKNFKDSALKIITLKEIFENANKEKLEIEDLFSDEDRQKFHIESKSSVIAKAFKNTESLENKISNESKANFYKVLTYLQDL